MHADANLRGDFVGAEPDAGSEGKNAGSIAVSVARKRLILCDADLATDVLTPTVRAQVGSRKKLALM